MTVKPPSVDCYKILNVSRTATTHEIKQAYRKLAMALHPDRTDGDPHKANVFKTASEAYTILSDHSKRTAYDNSTAFAFAHHSSKQTHARRAAAASPPNYRKVYSPKAPPGFKTFDPKRHYDMHYGDGMMREEVERARRRAEQASDRNSGYHYESPLGKGFSFDPDNDFNPYSKRRDAASASSASASRQGMFSVEYEETHYYDLGSGDTARQVVSRQQVVRERMHERRMNRIERRQQQQQQPLQRQDEEATVCSIM